MPRVASLPAVASCAVRPIQVQEKRDASAAGEAAAEIAAPVSPPSAAESTLEQPLLLLVASTQPQPPSLPAAAAAAAQPSQPAPALHVPLVSPLPPPLSLPVPPSPRPSALHSLPASRVGLSSSSSASSVSRPSQAASRPSPAAPLSLSLRSGHFSMQGLRSEMEDKTVLLPHPLFNSTGQMLDSHHRSYFAVFDGHGGDVCAEYSRQHVHLNFLSEAAFASRPALALQRALSRTDAEFCSACRRINLLSSSGTTALCAFLCGRKLVVANIGDSRAVLVKRSAGAGSGGAAAAVVALSCDHKPGRKDEKARIESLGGRVAVSEEEAWAASPSPACSFLSSCFASSRPLRVFPGGLSVSRTIGDIGVKSMRLVIAEAELWEGELTEDDGWLVLACDGVWDVMSNAAVAELVRRWDSLHQQAAARAAAHGKTRSDSARWSELAEVIAKEAFRRGSTDNISVIVVALQWERKQQLQQQQHEHAPPANSSQSASATQAARDRPHSHRR